jgi:AsmA protein
MSNRAGSGRGWVRWVIGAIVLVVVLLVAAVFVGPMLIPADTVREKITSAVHDSTGRDLEIKGGLSVSVFPTLAVAAKDVTFSNASWAGSKPMIALDRLDVQLRLLPLISGHIEVASFILEKPFIDLQTDKNGHGNWEFGTTPPAATASAAGAKTDAKPAQASAPAASSGGGMAINEIALGDVRITDGHVSYKNGITGKTEVADAINLKVSLANMDSPLSVDGSLHWHDKPIQLTLDAAKPRELMSGGGSQFGLKLSADTVKLAFAGTMGVAGAPKGTGDLDLSIPSIRNLVAWSTGQPMTMPGDGLGPFSIKGKVSVDGTKYTLAGVQLGLDAMKGTGDFSVDTGGARPTVKGKLAVDKLDLNHYMAPEKSAGAAQPVAAKTAAPAAGTAKTAAAPAATAPAGWSDDPIDASGLKAADATLGLSADAIIYRKVEIGKTLVQIGLDNGRLTLDLTDMSLYQGDVKGRVQVDGTGAQIATDANLRIDKVQVGPLMKAFADSDRVTGAVVSDTQVTSRGKSQRELVGALNGKGNFALQNGVVKGVDLVGMLKSAATSVVGGKSGETDFTTAGGTYVITNGILKNNDLAVSAPTLSATGAGTVDMPKRTLDYKVKAALIGALTVPINVTGPWDAIDWNVDFKGIVTENVGNAGKLVGSGVKGVGGAAGGVADKVKGGLGKLLGN